MTLSSAEHDIVAASGLLERCGFPVATGRVELAVSGGADSTALLVLALAAGLDARVIHIDHGLRAASNAEAGHVVALCARWNVAVEVRSVDIELGPNLEARARAARYAALPAGVCTGHTGDDRVETMLLNMLRGAGLDGLAPMRARFGPVRPLLSIRRHETVALCSALQLGVVDDPMNGDPSFRRVRVRHELLPLLDSIAQRDVVDVLARQADLFEADADLLDELSQAVDVTDALALASIPAPLAGRAIRRWLATAGVTPGPVADQATIHRVLDVAAGAATGADLTGGWSIRRRSQRLRLVPPEKPQPHHD